MKKLFLITVILLSACVNSNYRLRQEKIKEEIDKLKQNQENNHYKGLVSTSYIVKTGIIKLNQYNKDVLNLIIYGNKTFSDIINQEIYSENKYGDMEKLGVNEIIELDLEEFKNNNSLEVFESKIGKLQINFSDYQNNSSLYFNCFINTNNQKVCNIESELVEVAIDTICNGKCEFLYLLINWNK